MFGVALHKLLVHFPIALAVLACGYDGWALYARRPELHRTGSGLLRLAAVAAIAASGTGLDLAGMAGLGSASTVTGHAGAAVATTVVLTTAAVIRYSHEVRRGDTRDLSPGVFAAEALAAVLVLATAILGHRI